MTESPRDRIWIAALALAQTKPTFTAFDVLDLADIDDNEPEPTTHTSTATSVLQTMADYGYHESVDENTWCARSIPPITNTTPTGFDGTFTYLSAPRTRLAFTSNVVREWVESRLEGRVLNVFAGETRLTHSEAIVRNDLDDSIDADTHVDAAEIADHFEPHSFDTVLLDPPHDVWNHQSGTEHTGTPTTSTFERIKTQVTTLLTADGVAITFGRNSSGMGAARGFEKEELCLIAHPGQSYDTIAVVERRTNTSP